MNKCFLSVITLVLMLTGCSEKNNKAMSMIEHARALYERNELIAAKNEIDSIRTYYAEKPEVMKAVLELTWKVELKEAERNLLYCDSLLPIRIAEAPSFKKGFILEKDAKYQDTGNYIPGQLTVENNTERSYLRCGVSESGEIYIASVYFGAGPINHTGITLSIRSGLSASTASIPYDGGINYRFKDMGNTSEIVNYKGENGIDAIKFIYTNKERIKIDYTGGKPYSIYLDEASKKAVVATFELAAILSDISKITKERDIAVKKKAYLEDKLSRQ